MHKIFDKLKTKEARALLAEQIRNDRIFDVCTSENELTEDERKQRLKANAEIACIVKNHKIGELESEYRQALYIAQDRYWDTKVKEHFWYKTIGKATQTRGLATAIRVALGLMVDPDVESRLTEIEKRRGLAVGTSHNPKSIHNLFAHEKLTSIGEAKAVLRGLLVLADEAAKLDGRAFNKNARYDLRAAVQPLTYFWKDVARNSGKIGQRGGIYSPAVRFLCASLKLIDPSATESMIIEFYVERKPRKRQHKPKHTGATGAN